MMDQLLFISPYNWADIGTAILCGTLIGIERQVRNKPVGIRTSSLIVLGTYLFVVSASFLDGEALDPSRVVGQVITGIGFLGAGVMLTKDGAVVGVTSAASIWVLAALGVMIAMGHTLVAIKVAVLVVLLLWGVDVLEDYMVTISRWMRSKLSRRRLLAGSKRSRRRFRGDD